MASSGSAGQSGFRLGRAKKTPGVMDQIGKIFGGDKKRKSKGDHKASVKAQKGRAGDGQGTLTRIFKMGGTRAASPAKR